MRPYQFWDAQGLAWKRQRALKANSEAPDRFAANVRCVESPRRYLRAEWKLPAAGEWTAAQVSDILRRAWRQQV